jgi:FKBP-type peptidyl-prolyl cis-trans isomerase 2
MRLDAQEDLLGAAKMPKKTAMPRTSLFAVPFVVLAVPFAVACSQPVPEPAPEQKASAAPQIPDPPELVTEDLKVGEGREAKTGDKVKVNYVGRLLRTNFKFDSNEGKKPFEFTIGEGVIEGWSKGVVGMKPGGKRKLTIPSRLAYGDRGSPPKIPAGAPLVFEVELLGYADEDKDADAGVADAGATDAGADAADVGDKKGDAKKGDAKKDDAKKDDAKKDAAPKKDAPKK